MAEGDKLALVLGLTKTADWLTRELNKYFDKEYGVTFLQALALHELTVIVRPRPIHLIKRFGGHQGPMANLLTRLESKGLVERIAEGRTRNVAFLRLTAQGAEIALEIEAKLKSKLDELLKPVSAQERDSLMVLLKKLKSE